MPDMTPLVPSSVDRLAGHALVEALVAQGVDTVFGVPGESFLAALDGFHEQAAHIRFVACRHEGGAAFMAEAHGKLSGRPGVCFVTRGPGATNASTTGPGRPCIAVRNARATYSGRRSADCTSPTHFANPSVPGPNIWR